MQRRRRSTDSSGGSHLVGLLRPRAQQFARRWRELRTKEGLSGRRAAAGSRDNKPRAPAPGAAQGSLHGGGLEPVAVTADLAALSSSAAVLRIPSHPPPPLLEGRPSLVREIRLGVARASSGRARHGRAPPRRTRGANGQSPDEQW
jgi:hypothetical protein